MEQHNDKEPMLLDHNYDGIQEFDNPLPTWWLVTFFITIIFGFFYWLDTEIVGRGSQVQEVEKELAILRARAPKADPSNTNDDSYKAFAAVAANLAKGKDVYGGKCATCHGPEGQGMIGPNLTDNFWLHGRGGYSDVDKVVRQGVLDKGMPPWETQLNAEDIKAVTVFVVSLRGSSPLNPKAPQGEKVEP